MHNYSFHRVFLDKYATINYDIRNLVSCFFLKYKKLCFVSQEIYATYFPIRGLAMKFSDKLREARNKANLTQSQLAQQIGVSVRTVTNYETGDRYPKKRELYKKLAQVLNVELNYLLTEDEEFVFEAESLHGSRGKKQAKKLIESISGLFAGGELSQSDKDAVMQALQEAYWDAKKENKKYSHNQK